MHEEEGLEEEAYGLGPNGNMGFMHHVYPDHEEVEESSDDADPLGSNSSSSAGELSSSSESNPDSEGEPASDSEDGLGPAVVNLANGEDSE